MNFKFKKDMSFDFEFCYKQAGEERFSISMDEKNDVWYEILSFSKPASFLSLIGYPYVLVRQKQFARDSTRAMQKYLSRKLDDVSNTP